MRGGATLTNANSQTVKRAVENLAPRLQGKLGSPVASFIAKEVVSLSNQVTDVTVSYVNEFTDNLNRLLGLQGLSGSSALVSQVNSLKTYTTSTQRLGFAGHRLHDYRSRQPHQPAHHDYHHASAVPEHGSHAVRKGGDHHRRRAERDQERRRSPGHGSKLRVRRRR
jgi:hypothetical protein